ncbi:hypothetical protein [Bacillus altitudinis]|nr:hypothetical protein [Bacillus altitudinis]
MKSYKKSVKAIKTGAQILSRGAKNQKKSPPAGKFGLVFGLLGFWVLIF